MNREHSTRDSPESKLQLAQISNSSGSSPPLRVPRSQQPPVQVDGAHQTPPSTVALQSQLAELTAQPRTANAQGFKLKESGEDDNNFKVVVRVRPPLPRELPSPYERDERGNKL